MISMRLLRSKEGKLNVCLFIVDAVWVSLSFKHVDRTFSGCFKKIYSF